MPKPGRWVPRGKLQSVCALIQLLRPLSRSQFFGWVSGAERQTAHTCRDISDTARAWNVKAASVGSSSFRCSPKENDFSLVFIPTHCNSILAIRRFAVKVRAPHMLYRLKSAEGPRAAKERTFRCKKNDSSNPSSSGASQTRRPKGAVSRANNPHIPLLRLVRVSAFHGAR